MHLRHLLRAYPADVNLLFGANLLITLGRAITLPYLVIYLSERFGLSIGGIGLFVGSALILSSVLSLYGGFLVDRLDNFRVILGAASLFAGGLLLGYFASDARLLYGLLLAINLAFSVVDIAVKSGIGQFLPEARRPAAFSVKYTLTNIAYAVGPFIGAAVAVLDSGLPFLVSAAIALGFCALYLRKGRRGVTMQLDATPGVGFLALGRYLLKDSRLVCFTVGGILSAVVFGQFSAYLSQYLVATSSPENAYRIISYVLATNALVVILLQYPVGRRIRVERIFGFLMAGLGMFLLGLLGFALADGPLGWVLAMAVFTLGEIVVIPAEFLFIDRIAPEGMRGMYYSAQNLSNLGGAFGPVLCGAVLALAAPGWMFPMLALFVVISAGFYFLGARVGRGGV